MVMTAEVCFPAMVPIFTIASAKATASSSVFINAPEPIFTSSTIASAPLASFLLMILLAIRGIQSTVAVTSRSAYIFLSAGAKSAVCPIIAIPIRFTFSKNCSPDIDVENPFMLSSLSMVPPVCPKPLPDIFATGTPHAATMALKHRDVLSPTPPVLCLSTFMPCILERSRVSPESRMDKVRLVVSSISIPFRQTAIRKADI